LRPLSSKIFYYILQISSLLYLFLYLYSSRLFKVGIVLLMIFFIITFPLKEKVFNTYKRFSYMSICKSMVCQYDATTRYQIYPERYNNDARMKRIGFSEFHEPSMSEFIIMSAKGFGYAIFAPLPWQVRSKPELFASLEGYFMIISFLWVINGLLLCFRKVRYPFVSLPIIIPFFILLVLLTFFEGNVGTLLRHRTIMLPFYCALLAIGIGIGRKSYKVVL